ncbi:hypothetical protein [Phosphitispora fastidiosa]|uniref:hypothetical protein n=1 Tax=Phosphitispora fastidiosa TaxID=2837202 RepID=UPI001E577BBE|nr:hypothetical protein [Phosphitispora fastidiosa]MBU7007767.1 hypothetical protein [Phosphitispora fastidiosa]
MDASNAVRSIKSELESTFGNTMAASIIAIARTKANAPLIGMTKQNYLDLVDVICGDNRVQSMLGAAGAREKSTKWKSVID